MPSLSDVEEINENFEHAGKPIRLISGFKGVHNTALFKCSEGHEVHDIARNVINRTSTDVTKYCSQCKDADEGKVRDLMATCYTAHSGKPETYTAWVKKGSRSIIYHEAATKQALIDWCLREHETTPTWTRDNDQWDTWKLPLVITRLSEQAGTEFEWSAGRLDKGNNFKSIKYTATESEVLNFYMIQNYEDTGEIHEPKYFNTQSHKLCERSELI